MAEQPKYGIGQEVFAAAWESRLERIVCPECGGTKTLRCILWDGSEHTIDCAGCAAGYEPPRGFVEIHKRTAIARVAVIDGVAKSWDGVGFEYRAATGYGNQYVYQESDLFLTEAEALKAAEKMAADADQEELDKIGRKEKPTRTWAWHVHYHRREIRDAQKKLAYHSAKLDAAKANSRTQQDS